MQKFCWYASLFFIMVYSSCNSKNNSNGAAPFGEPVKQAEDILNDENGFAGFYYGLKLSRDFVALDTNATTIAKADFLQRVATGNYLPVELESKDSTLYYQLYHVTGHDDMMGSIKQLAQTEYAHYKMEGKPIPGFNYTDINGTVYNPQTTKDKIVVLKCWFIHCQKCNEEIPALNQLVDSYKNRNDIAFVSLAFDEAKDLQQFVAKKTFKYAVASVKEDYLINQLGVTEFPTHLVINKQGLVVKVVSDYEEMERVLNKVAMQ